MWEFWFSSWWQNIYSFILAALNELRSLEFCWNKHDTCESIGSSGAKNGMINNKKQQFWHCNCDMEFYDCLHRLNSTISNHIGELYFNYNNRCYQYDFMIKKCYEYDIQNGQKRCTQYLSIVNVPRKTQWFDLPFYAGKPMKTRLLTVAENEIK